MKKYGPDNPVVNQNGVPVDSATVTVYLTGTATLATLYSDDALTAQANPFTTSSIGEYSFYVEDGVYDITFSGGTPSITTKTVAGLEIFDFKRKPFYDASMFQGADAFAKIQAAHDALPSTGGHILASFEGSQTVTTTLTITKPCAIQGLGKRGTKFSYTPTSGNAITINVTAAGLGDTVLLSDFTLLGPGSGTGNGVKIIAGPHWEGVRVLVDDFGNDGIVVDTSGGGNANLGMLFGTESRRNGRYGLYLTGANSNVINVYGGSYSTNGTDGIRVDSDFNEFHGANIDDNDGYGLHFTSGAADNYAVVYAEQNTTGDINLASGSLRNVAWSLNPSAVVTVGDVGNGNAYRINSATGMGWRYFPLHTVFNNGSDGLTFHHTSDSDFDIYLRASVASGSERQLDIHWTDKGAVNQWRLSKTSAHVIGFVDEVNSKSRFNLALAGETNLNSGGTSANKLNVASGSGTGGTQFGDGAGNAVGSVNSAGLATFYGGVLVSSTGTLITKINVYTPSLTPALVAANTSAEQTFTVSGLTTADAVFVNPPSLTAGTAIVSVRVSATDTLAISWGNFTAGNLTPPAGTYKVVAMRS